MNDLKSLNKGKNLNDAFIKNLMKIKVLNTAHRYKEKIPTASTHDKAEN